MFETRIVRISNYGMTFAAVGIFGLDFQLYQIRPIILWPGMNKRTLGILAAMAAERRTCRLPRPLRLDWIEGQAGWDCHGCIVLYSLPYTNYYFWPS